MRAELKGIHTDDGDPPEGADYFGVLAEVYIGSPGSKGSDSFDVVICTPSWLADAFHNEGPAATRAETFLRRERWEGQQVRFGRDLILMQRWDRAELEQTIERLCAEEEGVDWGTVANRLSRWMPWEFDYRYDQDLDEVFSSPWHRALIRLASASPRIRRSIRRA